MKSFRWGIFPRVILAVAAAAILTLALTWYPAQAPVNNDPQAPQYTDAPSVDTSGVGEKVAPGAQIIQTMGFSRCGHSVTRRVQAPDSLAGAEFTAVKDYYSLWQIDQFSKERIEMSREIPLFCPMHTVVSVNEAGEGVLCRNLYGDGMAVIRTTGRSLDDFAGEDQEKLLLGLGFDTLKEAEDWLSAH